MYSFNFVTNPAPGRRFALKDHTTPQKRSMMVKAIFRRKRRALRRLNRLQGTEEHKMEDVRMEVGGVLMGSDVMVEEEKESMQRLRRAGEEMRERLQRLQEDKHNLFVTLKRALKREEELKARRTHVPAFPSSSAPLKK